MFNDNLKAMGLVGDKATVDEVCEMLGALPEFSNEVAGYFCIENIKGNTSDLGYLMKLHYPVDTLSMVEYEGLHIRDSFPALLTN
jgi:hypothetical protein